MHSSSPHQAAMCDLRQRLDTVPAGRSPLSRTSTADPASCHVDVFDVESGINDNILSWQLPIHSRCSR